MREILVKGKRSDDGEWVYGWYVEYPFGRWPVRPSIVPSEDARNGHFGFVKVVPETVGRYTGLTDENGKKIFEGDIVRQLNRCPYVNGYPYSEDTEIGVVYWDEGYCGWRRTTNGVLHRGKVESYRLSNSCCYEVIGNIHDNPELLGGAENG